LPDAILDRRKRGFSAPVSTWMTGALRDLVYDAVVRRPGGALPYFEAAAVERLVVAHDAGAASEALQVWGLLMFHLWHDWVGRWQAPDLPAAPPTRRVTHAVTAT
jgi:asparagine synthase (glutamine-hydrolysing)